MERVSDCPKGSSEDTHHDAQLWEPLMERLEGGKERFFQRCVCWCKRLQNLSVEVQHCPNT